MKYVPYIIPKDQKVLPDHFKESSSLQYGKNIVPTILGYIGAVFFFLSALAFVEHIAITILFGIIGFLLLPPGHNLIEKKFRFKLTYAIKTSACTGLIITALLLLGHYSASDKLIAKGKIIQQKEEQKEKMVSDQKDEANKDSFDNHVAFIQGLDTENKIDKALDEIDTSSKFATTLEETTTLQAEKDHLQRKKINDLIRNSNYKQASFLISGLLARTEYANDTQLIYCSGLCNYKTGKVKEAVGDLKRAIELGSNDAAKLHDKINPIRRHIVGHTTLCCDGSTSDATGRGACSWHGGVCDWNHPIYEEYRKYE